MEMHVEKKKEIIWNIKRKSLPGGFQLKAIQSGSGLPEVVLSMYESDGSKKAIDFMMNLDEFQNYFSIISGFYMLLESGDIDKEVQVTTAETEHPETKQAELQSKEEVKASIPQPKLPPVKNNLKSFPSQSNPTGLPIKIELKNTQPIKPETAEKQNLMEKYQTAKSELQKSVQEIKTQSVKPEQKPVNKIERTNVSLNLEQPHAVLNENNGEDSENFDDMLGIDDEALKQGLDSLEAMLNEKEDSSNQNKKTTEGFEEIEPEQVHTVFKKGTALDESEWDPW